MPSISREAQEQLDELNSRFIDALREVGFRGGERVNVLVTAEVLQSNREAARTVLLGRGVGNVHERARGIFRKRYTLEARSADFLFDEKVLTEWHTWAMNAASEQCISISIGVCHAELPEGCAERA